MVERAIAEPAHPAYGLDWNLVRSFEAVARAGSLAGGARLLGIAHPTIARHVQHLEEQLGLTLFARAQQGLTLNEAGESLLRVAAAMQESALAFQNAADSLGERPVANVRLTVPEMLAELMPHLALPSIVGLEATAPILEVIVSNEILNLLNREADIALRHARPTQQELIARKLGHLPVGLYASQDYLQQRGPLDFDNVADHRFVDGAQRAHLVNGARRAGLHIPADSVVFKSDAVSCQRAAIAAGWGIGALPTLLAASVDGLVSAMESTTQVHLEVWLVARPEVRDNAQMKRVYDGVGEALAQQLVVG